MDASSLELVFSYGPALLAPSAWIVTALSVRSVASDSEEVSRIYPEQAGRDTPNENTEMVAIRKAGNLWDKENLTLYTTLQPCMMCLATAIRCGIDKKNGVSTEALPYVKKHRVDIPKVTSGISEQESVKMFEQFMEEKKDHFARDYVKELMKPYQDEGRGLNGLGTS